MDPVNPEEGRKALEAARQALRDRKGMDGAIKAYLANLSGWRMVPEKLTENMDLAYWGYTEKGGGIPQQKWTLMIGHAPPPPGLEDSDFAHITPRQSPEDFLDSMEDSSE